MDTDAELTKNSDADDLREKNPDGQGFETQVANPHEDARAMSPEDLPSKEPDSGEETVVGGSLKAEPDDPPEPNVSRIETEGKGAEEGAVRETIPDAEDFGVGGVRERDGGDMEEEEEEDNEIRNAGIDENTSNKDGKVDPEHQEEPMNAATESGGEEDRPIVQLEATELDLADMDEEDGGKGEKEASQNVKQKRREENDLDVQSKRIKRWTKEDPTTTTATVAAATSSEDKPPKIKDINVQETTNEISRSNSQRNTIQRGNSFKTTNLGSNSANITPAQRTVPPSAVPPTPSLRINNFVRPFTQKQLSELLAKTGKMQKFWMDAIRTHCYVTYSSIEEATETRNALYNLQWPPQGGKLLTAHFVGPEDVDAKLREEEEGKKKKTEESSLTVNLKKSGNDVNSSKVKDASNASLLPSPSSQQHPPPPVPSSSGPSVKNENLKSEKQEEVALPTLDDLFRKTKAKPQVYFLPLTDEQVAKKLEAQKSQVVKPVQ